MLTEEDRTNVLFLLLLSVNFKWNCSVANTFILVFIYNSLQGKVGVFSPSNCRDLYLK